MPNNGLRKRTKPVTKFDNNLQQLIDEMIDTMRDAHGVGLAAPQIGRDLRMAVIETLPEEDEDGNEIPESRDLFVIINPEIMWHSRELVTGIEGCLSIPGYLGEVERSESIRVRALDRDGKKVKMRLHGWTARIFQHEIDHLDGVLFIDKLTAPDRLWTEDAYHEMMSEREEQEAG
jgi:peptide deformylase